MSMKPLISNMNKFYQELSDRQAEYLSHDPSKSQPYACMLCVLPVRDVAPLKQKVAELFTKCTKEDVSLNNFLTRSRMLVLLVCLFVSLRLRSLKGAGKAKAGPKGKRKGKVAKTVEPAGAGEGPSKKKQRKK